MSGSLGLLLAAAPAVAVTQAPQWTVTSVSRPTNFKPGDETGKDSYRVTVTDTGGASSDGSPVTITDELPAGLSLDPAGASGEDPLAHEHGLPATAKFTCVLRACTYSDAVVPGQTLDVTFPVDVSPSAPSSVINVVRVSGGGAPVASMSTPTVISEAPAGFGISPGGASSALSSTQAGAHPDITTSVGFNTLDAKGALAGDPKDTTDDLPPGFAGDLVDTPTCSAVLFALENCPVPTQIGVTTITLTGGLNGPFLAPVYNLAANLGEVAKLGFDIAGNFAIQGGISVRPGDYGLRATFHDINEVLTQVDNVSLTVWGVPADPVHDPLRWSGGDKSTEEHHFGFPSDAPRVPFFTNPTACGAEAFNAAFTVTSWEEPERGVSAGMPFGPIVGCDRVGMEPSLTVEATTSSASSATGLDLRMRIPQTYENALGLATSTLKRAVVTLPEGMTVNPSAGAGLGACSEAQLAQEAAQYVAGVGCPNESKLGEVSIVTPAIKEQINGSVFLAQPYSNPFGSLLALYIVARLPDRGIIVKSAGEVHADETAGRLVTTFDNLPPLPFSLFTFKFHSGATAPLVTPPTCGRYLVQAGLSPWSQPSQLLSPAIPPFPISSAFDGGACPSGGVPPFHPRVIAGTEHGTAGSYSPFYLRLVREDGEQELTRFSTIMPPGLTGNLTGIPFCPDASIEAAKARTGGQEETEQSCPAASQIGHTMVGAGVGTVLAQTPGRLYLAGPYHGAPFSLVSITSAKVGPFDLGTVVIRFALRINPLTAQVEVDATGSDPIPHIIKGIVVHVRDIRAYVDRPGFIKNPTSCEHMTIANTITGAGADPANPADQIPMNVTSPFQAADCQALAFKPIFQVSTSGQTSKANGESLNVKLTYPNAPQGTQANIHQVKVELPVQLPSRLTTLQKACTAAQFHTNPAGCPAASVVGHARAITPILPVPLEGPAYFVSNGGEAFPNLIIVLQGYGVTIDLVGDTFISKAGITSSTFKTVPDQPVTSFELTLPQGPFSALTANGDLCALTRTVLVRKKVKVRTRGHKRTVIRRVKQTLPASLSMPTEFVAQNGMTLHQNTPVGVTGCPKARPAKKKGKKR
ncbi:MAG TPA: hypothetical protein VNY27_04445 [Solirubrobacteraceae bacterium]|nr:hypothetical protein [Solirubrobacteraceae bacterium]